MKATDWDWNAVAGLDGPADPAVFPIAAIVASLAVGAVALAAGSATWAQGMVPPGLRGASGRSGGTRPGKRRP